MKSTSARRFRHPHVDYGAGRVLDVTDIGTPNIQEALAKQGAQVDALNIGGDGPTNATLTVALVHEPLPVHLFLVLAFLSELFLLILLSGLRAAQSPFRKSPSHLGPRP